MFTSCDDCDITDLSPEYVDCVEVCYNEIEMERANGQELDSLRVRMKRGIPLHQISIDNLIFYISRFVPEQRICMNRSLSLGAPPSARVLGSPTSVMEAVTTALDRRYEG